MLEPDGCSSAGGSDADATLIPISDKELSPEDVLKRLLKQTSSNEPRSDYEKALMPCNFPERLMDLLEKKVAEDAMWFLPGSDAIAIKPKLFSEKVLNKYFQGTKFESFQRKLYRWYVNCNHMPRGIMIKATANVIFLNYCLLLYSPTFLIFQGVQTHHTSAS